LFFFHGTKKNMKNTFLPSHDTGIYWLFIKIFLLLVVISRYQ
jgi:hypothetical protein